MLKLTALFGIALATIATTPTQAVVLSYTISGLDTLAGNQTEFASFQIDTDRIPDGYLQGIGFYYAAVPGTFSYGANTTTVPQDISFYLDAAHGYDDPNTQPGGLLVGEGDLLEFGGPQLFDGPVDNPTLRVGRFTLFDAFSGSPISLSVSAVPEPASWGMMVAGFATAGAAMRRRRPTPRLRLK
jgi:hypothetical protein